MDKQELVDIMSELNLTQRRVSEQLGVNIRTVRRWLNDGIQMKSTTRFILRLMRNAHRCGIDWASVGDVK